MTSDSDQQSLVSTVSQSDSVVDCHSQVRLKSEGERLLLILPPEAEMPGAASWSDLWEQLKHRLNAGERFITANSTVHLRTYALKRNLVVLSVVREAESPIPPLQNWLSA